ncbi:MAG TPA: MarR family transcriptional regulator [Patescibacteria group bacterium]|nr:MarR family transcriptional regulator [Patescibacteria group bacterium]
MRTIQPAPPDAASSGAPSLASGSTVDRIILELQDMISGLRCSGTGKLVKLGISMTHLHILWLLDHHGDLPMSHLADLLDVSLSNATGLVDRMVERGIVERVRVPGDRRVVLVRVAAEGVRVRDEVEAMRQDRLRAVLGRLELTQLERVLAATIDLRQAAAEEIGTDHLVAHAHRH